eukprot:760320-Hanusia_phi.AAC.1
MSSTAHDITLTDMQLGVVGATHLPQQQLLPCPHDAVDTRVSKGCHICMEAGDTESRPPSRDRSVSSGKSRAPSALNRFLYMIDTIGLAEPGSLVAIGTWFFLHHRLQTTLTRSKQTNKHKQTVISHSEQTNSDSHSKQANRPKLHFLPDIWNRNDNFTQDSLILGDVLE